MTSRIYVFLFLLIPLLGSSRCTGPDASPQVERPNIVLIMADDMGFSDIGAYGGEISTPNLDRMAEEGLRFSQFYNTGRCVPTRASLLTGQYSHRVGTGHMTADWGHVSYRGFLSDRTLTIAEALKGAGYRTMMTGKWHVGDDPAHFPRQRGFDRFYGIPAGGGVYFWPTILDRTVYLDDEAVEPDSGWYSTDAFTDYAVEFIDEAAEGEEPFFLYVAYIAPHFPLQAHEEDIQRYLGTYSMGWDSLRAQRYRRQQALGLAGANMPLSPRDELVPAWEDVDDKEIWDRKMATYAAMVDRLDQGIGRIIAALKKHGIDDETLVLFLSDNGGSEEHQLRGDPEAPVGSPASFTTYDRPWAQASNTPFRFYKKWQHEGGIATPLIAYWPGVVDAGGWTDEPGHVIDFLPTFLDLAGVTIEEVASGREFLPPAGTSLVPLLRGEAWGGHDALFWEHEGNRAVRQGRWKLVAEHGGPWELYDLEIDRTELHNLADQYPDRVDSMVALWGAWADSTGVLPWEMARSLRNSTRP